MGHQYCNDLFNNKFQNFTGAEDPLSGQNLSKLHPFASHGTKCENPSTESLKSKDTQKAHFRALHPVGGYEVEASP